MGSEVGAGAAPRTEAGRALVEHHAMIRMGKRWDHMLVIPQDIARVLVPEIEAEARQQVVEQIKERLLDAMPRREWPDRYNVLTLLDVLSDTAALAGDTGGPGE